MKKIIEIIKNYWNIWGSAIISFIVGWLMDFNKVSMDKTTSFLSMFLVMFAFLTVIKVNYGKHKNKTILEKGITSQKQLKAMESAINPMIQGEELYNAILETKKIFMERKRIKMFNWIKKNKGAIISLLELSGAIILHFTDVINFSEPWTTVTLVILYVIPVVTATLTSGFTSVETQKAVDTLKSKLKEAKQEAKQKIKVLNEQLITTKAALEEVNSNINKLELLRSINAPYDINSLSLYQAQQKQLQNTINLLEEQIEVCQNQQ